MKKRLLNLSFVYSSFFTNFKNIRIFTSIYEKVLQFHEKLFVPQVVSDDGYSNHFFLTLIQTIQKLGFSFLCVRMRFSSYVSLKILHYKLNKYDFCHLNVFGGASLYCFSLKFFCYKLHKHEDFHLYVSGDGT